MMRSKWKDSWLNLPRGQRRAIVALLCIIMLLSGVQMVAWRYRKHTEKITTDYSALEQEIDDFRSYIDTIPVEQRRPVYKRRTHALPDTAVQHIDAQKSKNRNIKVDNPSRRIEEVQRIK